MEGKKIVQCKKLTDMMDGDQTKLSSLQKVLIFNLRALEL
jgi:hypothetical protein